MTMNKIEKLMAQSILFAMDNLSRDIQEISDGDLNRQDAETIKILAEAYNIIKRGKTSNDN